MMLRSCFRLLERCFGRLGTGDGLLWHFDLKPHTTRVFSIVVVQANSTLKDQGQVLTSLLATYVGVYNGHGGPEASCFVNSRLFPHFRKFASKKEGFLVDVIMKASEATVEEFLYLNQRMRKEPSYSGSQQSVGKGEDSGTKDTECQPTSTEDANDSVTII